jgi:hypothetical protein
MTPPSSVNLVTMAFIWPSMTILCDLGTFRGDPSGRGFFVVADA